jgi:polyphosphate kinase
MDKKIAIVNRDISWLSFNERVLQEAIDPTVPLIERIKFLGIFSSNLDEFFRVRVASLKRMGQLGKQAKEYIGLNPSKVLRLIHTRVIEQQSRFETIYQDILKELENNHIFIVNEHQLNKEQGAFVKSYFEEKVRPLLVPIMIETAPQFPYLKDKSIYLAIKLSRKKDKRSSLYSLIEVPDSISRFLIIPKLKENSYIILLDDVIRYCLHHIFAVFEYDTYEAYTIKLTRDAELDIDGDLSKSITEKISRSLKQRKVGQPVRLVYDSSIPKDLLQFICKKMKLDKEETLIPGGRYHNFKNFIQFPQIGDAKLINPKLPTLQHKLLSSNTSMFNVIRKQDILLTYPYQSFDHIIDLLREAAIDPKVISIKISLYRAAKNSNVINALINAVKNGKQVTAVVELQARFDEQNNLFLANILQDEGAKVIYGVPGLKVHSKLFLITRKEGDKIISYAHVGTGNFNESTATLYADHTLLTADPRITGEVEKVFGFYRNNFKIGTYKHLIVSPFYMRNKYLKLVQTEIANAKAGKPAYIMLKLNSFIDEELLKKIYAASKAGVKIKIIVRGACAIVPGVKGISENIQVISIIDKYLEHARIFIFCNGNDEKVFISSADWMIRNLDHRSEVACPIYDKGIKTMLRQMFDIQWSDNTKARIINESQTNPYKRSTSRVKIRAQQEIYHYLKQKN